MLLFWLVCRYVKIHPIDLFEQFAHPTEATVNLTYPTINGKKFVTIPSKEKSIKWREGVLPRSHPKDYIPTQFFGERIKQCETYLSSNYSEGKIGWSVLDDAKVNMYGVIETPNFFYRPFASFPIQTNRQRNMTALIPTKSFDLIYPNLHYYSGLYYHQVVELGPLVLSIPTSLREQMKIIVKETNPFLDEFWELMGIRKDQIVPIDEGVVFGKKMIITTPSIYSACWPQAVRQMKRVVLEKLALPPINPDLFVIVRRRGSRYVVNQFQLDLALKTAFPWIPFTSHVDDGFAKQIEFWRKVKLVVGPVGNAFTNTLWMQNGTSIVEFNRELCETAYIVNARDNGVRTYEMLFNDQKGDHGKMTADIPLVIKAVKKALKDMGLRYK